MSLKSLIERLERTREDLLGICKELAILSSDPPEAQRSGSSEPASNLRKLAELAEGTAPSMAMPAVEMHDDCVERPPDPAQQDLADESHPGKTASLDSEIELVGTDEDRVSHKKSFLERALDASVLAGNGDFQALELWQTRAMAGPEKTSSINVAHSALVQRRSYAFPENIKLNKPWWILRPSCSLRLTWDVSSIILVYYDSISVPVVLAFDVDEAGFLLGGFHFCMAFWTFDIPLSFISGYYTKGKEEFRPKAIVINYMQSWFIFDSFLVTVDWLIVSFGMTRNAWVLARMGKTFRILRMLRSLRLLRLMKVRRLVEELNDRITSESFHIGLAVSKMIFTICFINHIIACAWWGIGNSQPPSSSWSRVGGYVHYAVAYQYCTSLHWSLTQFTPASMEVTPTNLSERIFSVLVLLFAMIVFSSFVSSITASMTNLRQMTSTTARNFAGLRRFLRDRNINQELSQRVMRCAEYQVRRRREEMHENDVVLLGYLSKSLASEVVWQSCSPYLLTHPFFRRYEAIDRHAMQQVCNDCLHRMTLSPGDILFSEATVATSAYFVFRGNLLYIPAGGNTEAGSFPDVGEDDDPDDDPKDFSAARSFGFIPKLLRTFTVEGLKMDTVSTATSSEPLYKPLEETLVHPGAWCSEQCLWTKWVHVGTMQSTTVCEMVVLDAQKFMAVTLAFRRVALYAAIYGCGFTASLNSECSKDPVGDLPNTQTQCWEELAKEAYLSELESWK